MSKARMKVESDSLLQGNDVADGDVNEHDNAATTDALDGS